jgi:hypothetical protein
MMVRRTAGERRRYCSTRTFFRTASSRPLICLAPSFNIELMPPAWANAMATFARGQGLFS